MMQRTKTYRALFYALLITTASLSVSCSGILLDETEKSPVTLNDLKLSFGTKDVGGPGTYTDTTFRVCLFATTTHDFAGFEGTYCSPNPAKDSRWLTPCKVVDVTGAYDSSAANPEATMYGLQARNGTYYMAIASPAVAMQSPRKDIYGFYYDRERPPGEKPLCVSDSISAIVSGVSTNGSWLYVVDDAIHLKERRSRLKLSISCGDDYPSATVKEIKFTNVLTKGYYLPANMAFNYEYEYLGEAQIKEYTPAITLYQAENPGQGHLKTDTCIVQPYILSMDYTKMDRYGNYVYPTPTIVVLLGADGNTKVNIPIAYDFLPEKIYSCNITINPNVVTLRLYVLDWEGHYASGGSADSFLQRPVTVTVNIWDEGTTGGSGDTEIHDSEW